MSKNKRIRDYGIHVGQMATGVRNALTDVPGVKVGHCTLSDGNVQTGVTAILPHDGNLFKNKVVAASHIINGFGKSTGLVQVEEMGVIETPLVLTNALSVGTVCNALIKYMLSDNKDIGVTTSTVNPVVFECNDGYLNDIRTPNVKEAHVFEAIENASKDFDEGAVGAGTGMSCFKLKGGIGTSSRQIALDHTYHLGAMVLSNMGQTRDLTICGNNIGTEILDRMSEDPLPDVGSIIIILATDAPLNERQLKRISKRAVVGLARTGSFIGTGSGEIVLAFSTKNTVTHYKHEPVSACLRVHEGEMDLFFRAAAEATEEAILNSMVSAPATDGRDGLSRPSLKDFEDLLGRCV